MALAKAFEKTCIERIVNEEVLRRLSSETELMMMIRTGQMKFIGHVMRRGDRRTKLNSKNPRL